ncbi:MAG: hypothetical protein V1799_08690 [bacterium]
MKRKNCWEVMQCGRQSGGEKVAEFGVCPAALPNMYDGMNKGFRGGRICWVVAGTFCAGYPKGMYAKALAGCFECEFLKQVHEEEGRNFVLLPTLTHELVKL